MNIYIVYFMEGAGHYSQALAMSEILVSRGHAVTIIDVVDIIKNRHDEKRSNRETLDRLYRGGVADLTVAAAFFFTKREVDIVISTVSIFNTDLFTGLRRVKPNAKYVTCVADLDEYTPGYYVPDYIEQHLIVGSDALVEKARAKKYPDERIHRVGGVPIHRNFYTPMDKQALKAHYGFDVSSKVGLVVFGGGGGEDMLSIQEALMDKPLVLICGSNYRLASKLTGRATGSKHLVLSSVTNMHLYTRLCDYFVGKPGTNCILEATICKLPLIVANVGKDSPHEITGLNYVKENSLGMAVSDFTNIRQNVEQLLSNADTYIANMTKQQITSVFEIPDVIEKIGRQT